MKYWLLLLLGCSLTAKAQPSESEKLVKAGQPLSLAMLPPIRLNRTPYGTKPLDIANYAWFYDDLPGLPEPFTVIRRQQLRPFAQRQQTYAKPSQSKVSTIVTWLAVRVQNSSPTQSVGTLLGVGGHGQAPRQRADVCRNQPDSVRRIG